MGFVKGMEGIDDDDDVQRQSQRSSSEGGRVAVLQAFVADWRERWVSFVSLRSAWSIE